MSCLLRCVCVCVARYTRLGKALQRLFLVRFPFNVRYIYAIGGKRNSKRALHSWAGSVWAEASVPLWPADSVGSCSGGKCQLTQFSVSAPKDLQIDGSGVSDYSAKWRLFISMPNRENRADPNPRWNVSFGRWGLYLTMHKHSRNVSSHAHESA